jgi:hypothetical protein
MKYFVSCIVACVKSSLAILAIFNARHMSDCSSCTRSSCLAIVADMLQTYKILVAASNNEIRLLPLPNTLRLPPQRRLKPGSSTHGNPYEEIW